MGFVCALLPSFHFFSEHTHCNFVWNQFVSHSCYAFSKPLKACFLSVVANSPTYCTPWVLLNPLFIPLWFSLSFCLPDATFSFICLPESYASQLYWVLSNFCIHCQLFLSPAILTFSIAKLIFIYVIIWLFYISVTSSNVPYRQRSCPFADISKKFNISMLCDPAWSWLEFDHLECASPFVIFQNFYPSWNQIFPQTFSVSDETTSCFLEETSQFGVNVTKLVFFRP